VFLTIVSGHGDYGSHVVPAMIILGIGLGLAFVAVTIAATTGVAPEDSGLASGLLNTTQQVGGSLGLAILSTVSTTRVTNALHGGAALPVALTHGFKGAFTVAGLLCAAGAVLALVLLPRRKRAAENEEVQTIALSFARCPGAPYCGHLARAVALARRMRHAAAPQ
jgi:MFS family permease